MEKSWILHGPQGSGKTRIAAELAAALGLSHVHDEWDGRQATFSTVDTLHVCVDLPRWVEDSRRVLTIDEGKLVVKAWSRRSA